MSRTPWTSWTHNFSGATGVKVFLFFFQLSKAWINAYLKLDDDDLAIICSKEYGEGSFPTKADLRNGELPYVILLLTRSTNHVITQMGTVSFQEPGR